MRSLPALGAILVLSAGGCSQSGYGSSGNGMMNMPGPTANPSSGNTAMVVIVGQQSRQAFAPDPAPIAPGALVVWHNLDTMSHHIVMNDGSFDGGDITPGGSSQTMRLGSTGGNYHCTIHPTTMFGSIVVATTGPTPSGPAY